MDRELIARYREYDGTPHFQTLQHFRDILRFPFEDPPSEEFLGEINALAADRSQYPDPEALYPIGPFTGVTSPESHLGPTRHAVDFVVPIGTRVLAAHQGKIIAVEDQHDAYGPTPRFAASNNYIVTCYRPMMDHHATHHHCPNDCYWCFVQYVHLQQHSATKLGLKVGDVVRAGQVIGETGFSGWMTAPNLHVMGFVATYPCGENPFGYLSLKMTFRTAADWEYYYAHELTWPGGVQFGRGHLD